MRRVAISVLGLSLGPVLAVFAGGCGDEGGSPDEGGAAEDTGLDEPIVPVPAPRVLRLTHAQWDNTVQDLFGLPESTGHGESFRTDPQVGGYLFDNDATTLAVDAPLWTGYRLAAAEVAELVTADAARLEAWVPDDADADADARRDFLRAFAGRAYRRPATDAEVAELEALMSSAPDFYPDVEDPFVAGLRHVVEAVLQSPLFLYRVESSSEVVTVDGLEVIALSDYEVAQRLSYFLWNTMPDRELFDAAAAGELDSEEGIAAQAERMVQDPRAGRVAGHFHHMLLELDAYDGILPSTDAFPAVPGDIADLAREETDRFVRKVIFDGGGGLRDLLTSRDTFVNDDLAQIYGVSGDFGDEFVRITLPNGQRSGVFTQVGFLASNATQVQPDPIHRGVFLARRVACLQIASPPDDVPDPPASIDEGTTNREHIEEHTSDPACAACHETLINPYGFALENFDAIGGWRDTDNGQPVDAVVEVLLDERVPVDGPVDLMETLAASEFVHRCYAQHWVEYALGRNAELEDDALIGYLGQRSLEERQSLRELMMAIATSPAFRYRAAAELEEP